MHVLIIMHNYQTLVEKTSSMFSELISAMSVAFIMASHPFSSYKMIRQRPSIIKFYLYCKTCIYVLIISSVSQYQHLATLIFSQIFK